MRRCVGCARVPVEEAVAQSGGATVQCRGRVSFACSLVSSSAPHSLPTLFPSPFFSRHGCRLPRPPPPRDPHRDSRRTSGAHTTTTTCSSRNRRNHTSARTTFRPSQQRQQQQQLRPTAPSHPVAGLPHPSRGRHPSPRHPTAARRRTTTWQMCGGWRPGWRCTPTRSTVPRRAPCPPPRSTPSSTSPTPSSTRSSTRPPPSPSARVAGDSTLATSSTKPVRIMLCLVNRPSLFVTRFNLSRTERWWDLEVPGWSPLLPTVEAVPLSQEHVRRVRAVRDARDSRRI